jgi:hypothetical protein
MPNNIKSIREFFRAVDKELQKPEPLTLEQKRDKRNIYQKVWKLRRKLQKLQFERRFFIKHYKHNKKLTLSLTTFYSEVINESEAKLSLLELEYYKL